ncbi:hypothetical protein TNCV_2089941 [Trichonephila clavipes]|nr:hypothetical protein TNCV_2089941 [Trichonephila clavipes]
MHQLGPGLILVWGLDLDFVLYARLTSYVKTVTPKCLGGPPVDHGRLNAYPGYMLSTFKELRATRELLVTILVLFNRSQLKLKTSTPRLHKEFEPRQIQLLSAPVHDIIKMGRTILLERRQSESVGRRNSRTTFLRSDWSRPFARREVGVEMELGRSENKRPEQRRS